MWSYPVGGVVHGSAVITSDNHVVFPCYDGNLYKLDTKGNLVWRVAAKAGFSSPLVDETNDKIYLGTNDNSTIAVTLSSGKLLWTARFPSVVTSSATMYKDFVFVGDNLGYFYKLDITNGNIVWKYLTGRTVEAAASVATVQGKEYLLFPSWDSYLYAFNPDVTGTAGPTWKFQTGKPIEGHAAVHNDVIYINSEDNTTYAIILKDEQPSVKWQFRMGAESDSAPAVSGDGSLLFFGSADTYFYGIR